MDVSGSNAAGDSAVDRLRSWAEAPPLVLLSRLEASLHGLTEDEAARRLASDGDNVSESPTLAEGADPTAVAAGAGGLRRLVSAARSPFVGLLGGLGVVLALVGDLRGALTVAVMVGLSVGVRSWQSTRSRRAVTALGASLRFTSTVRRRAEAGSSSTSREVPSDDVVVGDVVMVSAGEVIPADLRLLSARELAVDQAALSGEALPVIKHLDGGSGARVDGQSEEGRVGPASLVDCPSLCFAGTSVVSGSGTGLVVATGANTYLGSLAHRVTAKRPASGFDQGVRSVGRTLIRFMTVLVPFVLLVAGAVSGHWVRATVFAVAVAVGLTPEMLPVIVTTNLARGATRLARARVIVTRLNAIQDLGAVDVLCVDKTGTLTEDRVAYAHSIDPAGRPHEDAAEYAALALYFQQTPRTRLDDAVFGHLRATRNAEADELLAEALYDYVDEIPFDAQRRRATVALHSRGELLVICKGEPDTVLNRCSRWRVRGVEAELAETDRVRTRDIVRAHAQQGMRMLAVAVKSLPRSPGGLDDRIGESVESQMILVGLIGFVDPIAEDAGEAVRRLRGHGVAVKVLTGDHEGVAQWVCAQIGVHEGEVVLGHEVASATEPQLRALITRAQVFARLAPEHKTRIVSALQSNGHTVGFVGDGANDGPALRAADAGVAAYGATDVAKRAADLILSARGLNVIAEGIVEGRRTLANTLKYVHITAASNLGNVLTVVAASVFLPFVPILPVQLLVQNMLYDAAQLALPWDRVDADYVSRPRRWDAGGLVRFMMVFGPLSSLFDLLTFALLHQIFDAGAQPELFRAGWFVEGLTSQLLVVFVLRTAGPVWRGPRPSRPVVLASGLAAAIGTLLPSSPLAPVFKMHELPMGYLMWLVAVLGGYVLAAEGMKQLAMRLHGKRGW